MATGYFIGLGDKTSCGGKVLDADTSMMMFGFARAREGDRVSCGEDGETYSIVGGIPNMLSNGRRVAGTLDSVSSCRCRAKLIASNTGASYQSNSGPEPAQRAAAPAATSQPAAQQLGESPPGNPIFTPAFKSRWGEEPGFYIVPQSMSREALIAQLFDNFTPAASYRFNSLNPQWDIVKAGTLVVLSDPANLQCTREERLLIEAADIANSALESLSPEEANFMMRHREEISSFMGYGSTSMGIGEVVFARHLKEMETLLEAVELLHQRSFARYGHLNSAEFFAERKRLFNQLDVHLNGFTRKGTGFPDHPRLKRALGLSSRSLVHHWTQAGGPGPIPGYTTHLLGISRAAKVIKTGGWIGTAIGGGASYLKVQEVCAAGETQACKRVRYTETGSFAGGVAAGAATAAGLSVGAGKACVAMGLATGGYGLLACGILAVGAASYGAGKLGELGGEFTGELLYEATQ